MSHNGDGTSVSKSQCVCSSPAAAHTAQSKMTVSNSWLQSVPSLELYTTHHIGSPSNSKCCSSAFASAFSQGPADGFMFKSMCRTYFSHGGLAPTQPAEVQSMHGLSSMLPPTPCSSSSSMRRRRVTMGAHVTTSHRRPPREEKGPVQPCSNAIP